MNNKRKEIIVFTKNRDTFSNPTLVLFFRMLLERGHKVHLFAPSQYSKLPFNLPQFVLHSPRQRPPGSLLPHRVQNFLENIFFLWKAISVGKFQAKRLVIGIDPYGLILANRFATLTKQCTLGYLSFEIIFWDELWKPTQSRLKSREAKASQKIDFCLVQDGHREELLKTENQIQKQCLFFHVPVAPQASDQLTVGLRKPHRPCRIIFTGTLSAYTGVDRLLVIMKTEWDNEFTLEFHTRILLDKFDPYMVQISQMQAQGLPILIHDEVFTDEAEYHSYLNQFDIGLCFYYPNRRVSLYTGKNIEHIGLSSGKFSTFMMLGIPTITSKCETYSELNSTFCFGKVL
jgi:hypothetical protein